MKPKGYWKGMKMYPSQKTSDGGGQSVKKEGADQRSQATQASTTGLKKPAGRDIGGHTGHKKY